MDESAADCGQRSILNCIASESMSSWMCDEEESHERIRRSDTGQRQERNGKATRGQVRRILELKLDSKRTPEQPSTTMSRLQLFVRRFTLREGNTMPRAVEFSRWEPNPPDDRPNHSNPDPEKRDPVPGHPDPTMPPPEPRQDPPPEPQRGSLNLTTEGQSRVE
jgi:hypothetical protein